MRYTDLENVIISYILSDGDCDYEYFLENIKPQHFTRDKYAKLCEVLKNIVDSGETPSQKLILMSVNISDFSDAMTEYPNVMYSEFKRAVNLIKIKYSSKQARKILTEELEKLEDDEATDFNIQAAFDNIKNRLDSIEIIGEVDTVKLGDISIDYLQHLLDLKDGKINRGLSLGYDRIDALTHGLDGNRIMVVGAMESMGKSSIALNFALNIIKQKKSVLMFSLEMNEIQLMDRCISIISGIDLEMLKNTSALSDENCHKIGEATTLLNTSNFFINTNFDINSDKMIAYAMSIKKKHGLDCVIIDHLQLLGANEKGMDERARINYASRNLKRLTKVLDIPVIVLAQVNRDSNDPYGLKVPSRKRLKESGNIEADADIVLMAHRILNNADGTPVTDGHQEDLILYFDKNRDGPRKMLVFRLDLTTQRVIDNQLVTL